MVNCKKCGKESDPQYCRQASAKSWYCLECQRINLCLHRSVGTTMFVKDWGVEDVKEFYKECRGLTPDGIFELAEQCFKRYKREEDYYSNGGEFLPLSVWKTHGWNTDLIENFSDPDDIREIPQAGKVYRVKIMASGTRGVAGREATRSLMAQSKRLKRTADQMAAAATAAAAPTDSSTFLSNVGVPMFGADPDAVDDDRSSSSVSSSTSSSSSSSRDKKKKKSKTKKKKSKKEEKAKQLRQDKKQKEEARQSAQEQKKLEKSLEEKKKKAGRIQASARTMLNKIERTVQDPKMAVCSPATREALQDHMMIYTKAIAACEAVATNPMAPLPFESPKDLPVKEANKVLKKVNLFFLAARGC